MNFARVLKPSIRVTGKESFYNSAQFGCQMGCEIMKRFVTKLFGWAWRIVVMGEGKLATQHSISEDTKGEKIAAAIGWVPPQYFRR
jgi:hypothetical protein